MPRLSIALPPNQISLAALEEEYDAWVAAGAGSGGADVPRAAPVGSPVLQPLTTTALSSNNCRQLIDSPLMSGLTISKHWQEEAPLSPASVVGLQLSDDEQGERAMQPPSPIQFMEWQPSTAGTSPFRLPASVV